MNCFPYIPVDDLLILGNGAPIKIDHEVIGVLAGIDQVKDELK
ncbi:hypothetical protein [Rhizobium sp. SYY.PMSO]